MKSQTRHQSNSGLSKVAFRNGGSERKPKHSVQAVLGIVKEMDPLIRDLATATAAPNHVAVLAER